MKLLSLLATTLIGVHSCVAQYNALLRQAWTTNTVATVNANGIGWLGGQPTNALLTDISAMTPAVGDLITYDGADFVELPVGSAGQILMSAGAAVPTWQNVGAMTETNMFFLDNVAGLGGVAGAGTKTNAWVAGYTTANDGGEGMFYWSPAGTADGGITFADSGAGFWHRYVGDQPIQFAWYGPAGDGVTDDQVKLLAAIAAAKASSSKILELSPKTYKTTTEENIDISDITIQGRGATLLDGRTANHPLTVVPYLKAFGSIVSTNVLTNTIYAGTYVITNAWAAANLNTNDFAMIVSAIWMGRPPPLQEGYKGELKKVASVDAVNNLVGFYESFFDTYPVSSNIGIQKLTMCKSEIYDLTLRANNRTVTNNIALYVTRADTPRIERCTIKDFSFSALSLYDSWSPYVDIHAYDSHQTGYAYGMILGGACMHARVTGSFVRCRDAIDVSGSTGSAGIPWDALVFNAFGSQTDEPDSSQVFDTHASVGSLEFNNCTAVCAIDGPTAKGGFSVNIPHARIINCRVFNGFHGVRIGDGTGHVEVDNLRCYNLEDNSAGVLVINSTGIDTCIIRNVTVDTETQATASGVQGVYINDSSITNLVIDGVVVYSRSTTACNTWGVTLWNAYGTDVEVLSGVNINNVHVYCTSGKGGVLFATTKAAKIPFIVFNDCSVNGGNYFAYLTDSDTKFVFNNCSSVDANGYTVYIKNTTVEPGTMTFDGGSFDLVTPFGLVFADTSGATTTNLTVRMENLSLTGTGSILYPTTGTNYNHVVKRNVDTALALGGGSIEDSLLTENNGVLSLSVNPAHSLTPFTVNTNQLIVSSGKVGISTTVPSYTLDVTGDFNIRSETPYMQFNDTTAAQDDYQITCNASYLRFKNQTQSRYDLNIDGSGNIGIATNTPSSKLHVHGDIRLNNSTVPASAADQVVMYSANSAAGDGTATLQVKDELGTVNELRSVRHWKSLTDETAVTVFHMPVVANEVVGGNVNYTIQSHYANAGTNLVIFASGSLTYSAGAEGTTVVASLDDVQGADADVPAAATGTVTWAWTANVATNNVLALQLNANTEPDDTPTTFRVMCTIVDNNNKLVTKD